MPHVGPVSSILRGLKPNRSCCWPSPLRILVGPVSSILRGLKLPPAVSLPPAVGVVNIFGWTCLLHFKRIETWSKSFVVVIIVLGGWTCLLHFKRIVRKRELHSGAAAFAMGALCSVPPMPISQEMRRIHPACCGAVTTRLQRAPGPVRSFCRGAVPRRVP